MEMSAFPRNLEVLGQVQELKCNAGSLGYRRGARQAHGSDLKWANPENLSPA